MIPEPNVGKARLTKTCDDCKGAGVLWTGTLGGCRGGEDVYETCPTCRGKGVALTIEPNAAKGVVDGSR